MDIPIYHVDAFSQQPFHGNPAAVCPLQSWLPDSTMQSIAHENNLSETAFFVATDDSYELRWFTPKTEIDLCGHATLASAFVIQKYLGRGGDCVRFRSPRSGELRVRADKGGRLTLVLPRKQSIVLETWPPLLERALGHVPMELRRSDRLIAVYESERQIRALTPDFRVLKELDEICVTAPGDDVDFVSRYFAPKVGIDEDPVTGSAHCSLVPYWAKRLKKTELFAKQVSERGGEIWCRDGKDSVELSGFAVCYLKGEITV